MAYSTPLLEWMRREGLRTQVMTFEDRTVDDEPSGGTVRYSSVILPGYTPTLAPESRLAAVTSLRLVDYASTFGAWTVRIEREGFDPRQFRRGMMVILRAGETVATLETVLSGQVMRWDFDGSGVTVHMIDLAGALRSRFTTTATAFGLFGDLATSTLAADYAVSDTTLTLASGTGFNREDGENGLIYIVPDPTYPGNPEPFYLEWSSRSGADLTVIAADVYDTTRSALLFSGYTHTIYLCAYVVDHPANIARKVLASTGTAGANGPHDTLPAKWGMAIDRALLDNADIAQTIANTQPASGADDWVLIHNPALDEAVTDPGAFLSAFLTPGGFFLAVRMSLLTVRAVQYTLESVREIGPDDYIAGTHTWISHDPEIQAEWATVTVQSRNGATDAAGALLGTSESRTETITSLPARAERVYQIPVWDNESALCSEVLARVAPWALNTAQVLEVTLWSVSGDLAIGDFVRILDPRIILDRLRVPSVIGDPFPGVAGMLVSVGPDWIEGKNPVRIAFPALGAES